MRRRDLIAAAVTAANGVTYDCNGADGQDASGGGLTSLDDLDGVPCTGPGGARGSTQVTVQASGEVGIQCAGVAVRLDVHVSAGCTVTACRTTRASIETGGNQIGICEVRGDSLAGPTTNSCQYWLPPGASVLVTADVSGVPNWSGDCAGAGTDPACSLTMSTSKSFGLDYQ
jgi:hypothetical protein